MTTPERLRRRQRRETAFIAVLAFGLVGSAIYFRAQDVQQDQCLAAFLEQNSSTSTVRSSAVEAESEATRNIIRGVFTATTRKDVQAAYENYKLALEEIDEAREANPVRPFPEGACD